MLLCPMYKTAVEAVTPAAMASISIVSAGKVSVMIGDF